MRLLLAVSLLFLLTVNKGFAQYVNTDELVFVHGMQHPISLDEYLKLNEVKKERYESYLASFLIPGPDTGSYILSSFGPRSGRMHYGTDIKMANGDTVYAVNSGHIIRSCWGSGFGNLIVIEHNENIETYYAHLSKFLKRSGDRVTKGEAIGLAGSTGRARGPHLHFEIHQDGQAFDPELVFDFQDHTIREEARDFSSLVALHRTLKPKGYSGNQAIPEYYKVRSGDSLWVISKKYKTPITELCRLNKISENTVLQIGQPIKMY